MIGDRRGGARARSAGAERRLPPLHQARAGRHRARHRAVELSVSHGRSTRSCPALMAGNAVILKHAAQTLLVGERFQAAFDKAGLPKGLFQNLVLGHDADREADRARRKVDHVSFTGSVAGGTRDRARRGRHLRLASASSSAARTRPMCCADAKLDHAVENLVDGAFFNSGQCCCGIERIYVHEKVYEPVRRRLRRPHQAIRRRQSARSGDDARADGAARASPTSCASRSPRRCARARRRTSR